MLDSSLLLGLFFPLAVVSRGYSLVAVHMLLIAVAFLVVEYGLQTIQASLSVAHGFASCSSRGLEGTGSIVVAHRLSFSMTCGMLSDQGSNICTGR